MKVLTSLLGGLAGAMALNLIHETYRQLDDEAPKVHLIGEEAIAELADHAGMTPPTGRALYATTLAGDLLGNALFYSLAGLGRKKDVVLWGAMLGLTAGAGALKLTAPLGLDDRPVNRTRKTQALTISWYVIGGLVAGLAMKKIQERQ